MGTTDPLVLGLVIAVAVEAIAIYFVHRMNSNMIQAHKIVESDQPESFIPFLENKVREQDAKIADLTIKLEVIEMRLTRPYLSSETLRYRPKSDDIGLRASDRSPGQNDVMLHEDIVMHESKGVVGASEKEVLKALMVRDLTAADVMSLLSCTREHAARLMKSMFSRGLVSRNTGKRPFVYSITEEGRKKFGQV